MPQKENEFLNRIVIALKAGGDVYLSRPRQTVGVRKKRCGDPVTDVECEVNQLLFETLVQDGEGWLSEESKDGEARLQRTRTWVVDPLDGTKEYLAGRAEWCISIALIEDGELVAGGIYNPPTNEMFLASAETGVICKAATSHKQASCENSEVNAVVLASRSEVERGLWDRFQNGFFRIEPLGSIAYKLALVAAGRADATWTLVPKHEWDVAAGVALVSCAKGHVVTSDGSRPSFNNRNPLLPGLVAFSAAGIRRLHPFLASAVIGSEFEDCVPWVQSMFNAGLRL